jgi:trans-2,3-dihydro-3-hydroxyanthranilate isomerase
VRLPYEVVDVFTDVAFAGNALAVVLGGEGLSTEQCQAIAREFNLSETTFVLPTERAADYRLRIFTPGAELPFAGHPSVGSAWVQRERGAVSGSSAVQDCLAGLLPLAFRDDGMVEITGGTPVVGDALDPTALLAAVGLESSALAPGRSARAAGTGSDFTYVCVHDDAVSAAGVSGDVTAALAGTGGHGLYLFSWDDGAVHARMFAPGLGVSEDPATGSAATGLGAWLAVESLVAEGPSTFTVSQGAEVGRPSTLYGTVVVQGGVAVECRVAGHVVPVGRGEIAVPEARGPHVLAPVD